MSCGDAWCAGGYRARRRAAERTTTGRRVRMFGVRDIMSRRIARARRAGGRELRRCGLRVDDKKRKIGIASCFMRYLCRGSFGVGRGCPGAADRIRCSPRPPHLFAARLRRGSSLSAGRSEVGSAGGHASIAPEIRRLWIVLGFRDYCLSLPLSGSRPRSTRRRSSARSAAACTLVPIGRSRLHCGRVRPRGGDRLA